MDSYWFHVPIIMFFFFNVHLLYTRYIKRPNRVCDYNRTHSASLHYIKYMFFAMYPYLYANFPYGSRIFYNAFHITTIVMILYGVVESVVHHKKIVVPCGIWYFFVFIVYIAVSGLLLNPSVDFYIGIRNALVFFLAIFVLYHDSENKLNDYRFIARVNVVILALLGVFQYVNTLVLLGYTTRVFATLYNANTYGLVMLINLYFATDRVLGRENLRYFLFAVIGIVLSVSSSAMIGLLIWSFYIKGLGKSFYKLIFTTMVVGMSILIAIRVFDPMLFNDLFKNQSDRMFLWAVYLNVFTMNPIWGTGYHTGFTKLADNLKNLPMDPRTSTTQMFLNNIQTGIRVVTHNDFIKIITETGIIGIGLLLAFMISMCHYSYKERDDKHIKILLIGFLYFMVQNLFQEYHYFFVFLTPLLYVRGGRNIKIIV